MLVPPLRAGGGTGRPPQLPRGGGRTLPVARRCGLAFPLPRLVIYHFLPPPPLFLLPPPAFLLRSGSSPALPSRPPSSLPLPHPSLFLKNVGSGVQPPALAAALPARAALSPPPPAEPPALSRVPPIPRPGGAGCGRGERSQVRSCARGDLPQVSSRLGFIANFGLFLLFLRGTDRWGRAGAPVALEWQWKVWRHKSACGGLTEPRDGRGRCGHPAPGRRDDVCSPLRRRCGDMRDPCVLGMRQALRVACH